VVVCAFLIGGAIGEYLANDWKAFLAGSMVVKYGVGIATATLVTYVSEIAPFQIRGTCIAAYQLFLGMGQLLSAIAAKIITETNPTEWRPLIASEFCFTGGEFGWDPILPVRADLTSRSPLHPPLLATRVSPLLRAKGQA
jgi:MFS family permease